MNRKWQVSNKLNDEYWDDNVSELVEIIIDNVDDNIELKNIIYEKISILLNYIKKINKKKKFNIKLLSSAIFAYSLKICYDKPS